MNTSSIIDYLLTDCNSRIAVHRLINFRAIVVNFPDWIFLGLAIRIESDGVVFTEIRRPDPAVVRTDVDEVSHFVVIVVVEASVADSVA